ncbi:MAG TPA: hypothetical protein VNL73_10275 [Verrucomicrobiae bacterium]|nr:hypothetical protein [Verrucomicrobiae bacterium]
MFKRWLAVLGTVVLLVCTFQLLWGGGGGEEYPWGNSNMGEGETGGTGNSRSSASSSSTVSPAKSIFIVRPAPMGGYYIVRVNLPSDGSAKPVTGRKKVEN